MSTNGKYDNINYILVTGGLGFIGSHVVVKLLEEHQHVVVIDNLANSNIWMLDKIEQITGDIKNLIFIEGDIRDRTVLEELFKKYKIITVMHFAALKSVSESEKYPDLYQDVNVTGTKLLIDVMKSYDSRNFIYSSSATVYGDSMAPVSETSNVGNGLTCNYARNKFDIEKYLIANYEQGTFQGWNIVILRYFNPIGAHPSGIIGEDPQGVPNNVFPYLLRVASRTNREIDTSNKIEKSPYDIFTIYGNNYETRDGTCIRDYIHVQDLARAHVEVMKVLDTNKKIRIYNVGTGKGSTVMELVNELNKTLEAMGKKQIKYVIGDMRVGDLDISFANVNKIKEEIGFKTEYGIDQMCTDGLNFVQL